MLPPHQPKSNDFGRKISLYFEKLGSISGCIPPTSVKLTVSVKKSLSISVKTFFFFGDHLILGGKNVRICDFGRKIALNFGEDIRIFEGLCLKSPPHQNFLDPPLIVPCFFCCSLECGELESKVDNEAEMVIKPSFLR